jgi:hypothetical protein
VPSAADWRHWCAIIEGGGRRNFTYLPTPTCLHFSANWKKSRYSAVEEVRTWLEVADSSAWWPPALRYSIPPGTTEQQVIADAMRAGGSTWREDVRAASALVIDRLSWDDIRIIRPTLRASNVEIQRLRTRLGTIELEAERARCELESRELESQQLLSRIRTLEDEYARAREALAALDATRAQVQALQSRLALTLTSTSWRITAPMRNLKELWTGIGARR